MKRVLVLILLLTMAIISSFAQEKDVTKFLGIPIDGTKEEMISKLKEKGFTSTAYDKEVLEGEFNGEDVYLFIGTNNHKVYRIMVSDKTNRNEENIRIRYNTLCKQFAENDKYLVQMMEEIASDEDIALQILTKKKQYQASFYQIDKPAIDKILLNKYSKEQLENTEQLSLQDQIYIAETYQNSAINKQVWFMISENIGKYCINIYYDNTLNMANGEDL